MAEIMEERLMFCHCCSNGTLDNTCMYGREAECGIPVEDAKEIAARIARIVDRAEKRELK